MDWIATSLRHSPELAIFQALALGHWFGSFKLGSFSRSSRSSDITIEGFRPIVNEVTLAVVLVLAGALPITLGVLRAVRR